MVLPDTSYLRKDLIVSDVIYMPEKTKLLEEAENAGVTVDETSHFCGTRN